MKATKTLILLAMFVFLAGLVLGCSNPDNLNLPPLPTVIDDDGNPPPDSYTPIPFAGYDFGTIFDIGFEKDWDTIIAHTGGLWLFDTFGTRKDSVEFPFGGAEFWGMASNNGPDKNSSGRGIFAAGPITTGGWTYVKDDLFVNGGATFTTGTSYGYLWWQGNPHPDPLSLCGAYATSSDFEETRTYPTGMDFHPQYGWLFIKVNQPNILIDTHCDLNLDDYPSGGAQDDGEGVIAINPFAPGLDGWMEGAAQEPPTSWDYVVYKRKTWVDAAEYYDTIVNAIPPWGRAAVENWVWDETSLTYEPPRDGVTVNNISDFEFDSYGRLIVVIPNANAWAITDPVTPPEVITTQRIIGGAMNGTSHAPGDFYGPRGVAIDPRNQEIYITDTGLNRVQVFDNQGNYIRMFGYGIAGLASNFTAPTAIKVDGLGNVYVSTDQGLQIFNENGTPVTYGSVDGYVFDKVSGVGLDNTVVSLASTYRQYITETDDDGFFRFSTVPQGSHTVIANRDGYDADSINVFINGGETTTTTVYIDRTGIGDPGVGTVTGTLLSSIDGDPLPGLVVTVKGSGVSNYSNGNGEFELLGVTAGPQVLQVFSGAVIIHDQNITVISGSIQPLGYIKLPI